MKVLASAVSGKSSGLGFGGLWVSGFTVPGFRGFGKLGGRV